MIDTDFLKKAKMYRTAFHLIFNEYVSLISAETLGDNVVFTYRRINKDVGTCYASTLTNFSL